MRYFLTGSLALSSLWLVAPAQAQTLSLSPAVTTAASGDTVSFSVVLSDGPNDTSNVGSYNFTVSVDPQYLRFATSGAPYANSTGFTTVFANTANNGVGTLTVSYAYGFFDVPINEEGKGPLTLGTFTATVLKPVPVGGALVGLGGVGFGSSESAVQDANTQANVLLGVSGARVLPLVAAPEPSGALALLIGTAMMGAVGLAGTAWRSKRRVQTSG